MGVSIVLFFIRKGGESRFCVLRVIVTFNLSDLVEKLLIYKSVKWDFETTVLGISESTCNYTQNESKSLQKKMRNYFSEPDGNS